MVSAGFRKKEEKVFDSSIYKQLAEYVESVVLKRVFTVIDIIEKVHLGSRKANEISKLQSTASKMIVVTSCLYGNGACELQD